MVVHKHLHSQGSVHFNHRLPNYTKNYPRLGVKISSKALLSVKRRFGRELGNFGNPPCFWKWSKLVGRKNVNFASLSGSLRFGCQHCSFAIFSFLIMITVNRNKFFSVSSRTETPLTYPTTLRFLYISLFFQSTAYYPFPLHLPSHVLTHPYSTVDTPVLLIKHVICLSRCTPSYPTPSSPLLPFFFHSISYHPLNIPDPILSVTPLLLSLRLLLTTTSPRNHTFTKFCGSTRPIICNSLCPLLKPHLFLSRWLPIFSFVNSHSPNISVLYPSFRLFYLFFSKYSSEDSKYSQNKHISVHTHLCLRYLYFFLYLLRW